MRVFFEDKKLKKLINVVKDIDKKKVRVGVLGGDYEDGTNIAFIAMVHEMGSVVRNIPSRSFIKSPLETHLKDRLKEINEILDKVLKLEFNVNKAFHFLGITGKNICLDSFKTKGDGTWVPLKEQTIKRKKSSSPLIDTGRLRKSINYDLVNK